MASVRSASRSGRSSTRESGSAALELVIAVPVVMLMMLVVVQFAVLEHGSNVAQAAARVGLQQARLNGGSTESGEAQTRGVLSQLAGGTLIDPSVAVVEHEQVVTVRVNATAEQVVPGLRLHVSATATGPREEFR